MAQVREEIVPGIPTFEVVESFDAPNIPLTKWRDVPADVILEGNPAHTAGRVLYRDPGDLFSVGIWECPPSKFEVSYAGTEMGHVLHGSATITDKNTGRSVHIKGGDRFIAPFGSTVIWHVHETIKKVYCMYEAEKDDERFY